MCMNVAKIHLMSLALLHGHLRFNRPNALQRRERRAWRRRNFPNRDLPVLAPASPALVREHRLRAADNRRRTLIDARLWIAWKRDVLVFLFVHVKLLWFGPTCVC